MTDKVNKPNHYVGSNGLEDYKKARKNLDQVIEYLENQKKEQVKIELTPNRILIDWIKLINEK